MRFVIVHGTKGSPQGNWFPWLKTELEEQGHDVIVPQFPTPDGQNAQNWLTQFEQNILPPYADTILIGHSIGATFLINLLHNEKEGFAAAYFVAPVMGDIHLPEYDHLNNSFYKTAFDWAIIRSHMGKSMIFHGDDDPYVPLSHAELLAQKLDAPLRVIPQGGHLNAESGYTHFPNLLHHLTS